MELVYLWVAVFVGAGLCGAVAAVIRSLKDSECRVIQVTQMHYRMLSIAQRMEDAIGQLHLSYEWTTGGWAESGRMSEALRQARRDLKIEEERLVAVARRELMELQEELVDTSLLAAFEKTMGQLSHSFPWLGRWEQA